MRILVFLPYFCPWVSVVINERQFLVSLAKRVDGIVVVTLVSPKHLKSWKKGPVLGLPKNVSVIPIPLPRIQPFMILSPLIVSLFLSLVCRLLHFDGIYVRDSLLATGFVTQKSLAERTVVKITYLIEDSIREEIQSVHANVLVKKILHRLISSLDRLALRRARSVAVSSHMLGTLLISRRGIPPMNPLMVLTPGVSFDKLKSLKSKKRRKHRLAYMGPLEWCEGVDVLAEAMPLIMKKSEDVELFIVGDGPLRQKIEEICRRNSVEFTITGFVPHRKALELLTSSELMVVPRRSITTTETKLSMNLIEAMALGVPIIAAKNKILDHMFKDKKHLIFLPKLSPQDIAKKTDLLLENHELQEKISRNAALLTRQFDYGLMAERFLEVLRAY